MTVIHRLTGCSALLLAATGLAQAACQYPATVNIPDGAQASREELEAAHRHVTRYMRDMEAYLACLDKEVAALPEEQRTAEVKALHTRRHNSAIDAMEAVAADFNAQLRASKSAN